MQNENKQTEPGKYTFNFYSKYAIFLKRFVSFSLLINFLSF